MAPLFANSLFQDLTQLFTEADDYNVKIEVGEGSEKEIFKAHSVILRARSPYFKAALSSTWVRKVDDMIIFSKPNISPKVFKKILKYIYTGEFSLMEDDIQDMDEDELLTEEDNSLIVDDVQDILLDLLLAADELALKILLVYLRLHQKKPTLLEFIERDDLNIEEVEIWENLIKWAHSGSPPEDHLPPRVPVSQTVPDSVIVSNKQLTLIESWIVSSANDDTRFNLLNEGCDFYLLLRGSRDGMGLKPFHSLCLYKGPTLVVIKIKGTNQVIGGYNPDSWSKIGGSKAKDSFIFSLGKDKSFNNIILSRIEYNKVAVSNSGFEDLRWFEGKYHKSNFERQIMENSDEEFIIEDYEVFRVVRCCE
ncbi:unnamed protein product [Rhizophagus irregularis]|nr:unnamed protein product [Rhizophagus irregularis]